MAHFLDINQMAEECNTNGWTDLEQMLISITGLVADKIASHYGIAVVDDAKNEPGFAGLCVGFGPKEDGQKCPEALLQYDTSSGWSQGEP